MRARGHRLAAGTVTLVALAGWTAASLHWAAQAQERGPGRRRPRPVPASGGDTPLIDLELHDEAATGTPAPERPPLAPATALSPEETKKVLERLAPLAPEPGADFSLRESSLPPPRTGKTVEEAFPPKTEETPPVPEGKEAGPLEVLRHMPDGEVPLAPHLSLTFSQPMVAVTSHEATVASIPVKLTPDVPGAWRWIGTKTLLFEPKPRFPMATEYTVEVPAGTTSAIGGKLASAFSFTFATPPPALHGSWPQGGSVGLAPTFFASFDQAIDPSAVLATIELREGGRRGATVPLALATPEQIDADPQVASLARSTEKGRWLAFRATTTLPKNTAYRIQVGPKTPSAEGPRTTKGPQGWSFRTYGPLALVRHWPEGEAPPWGGWSLQFSNPLDAAKFSKELVTIEPALPRAVIGCSGNMISISGAPRGRTTYKVTVSAALTDIFGQTLGTDTSVEFRTGSLPESFWGPEGLVVLDPAGPRSYSVWSVNEEKLKLRVYAVGPEQWSDFQKLEESWQRDRKLGDPPGKCVVEDTVKPKGDADEIAETRVDLSDAFDSGFGHAIVILEPREQPENPWQRRAVIAWVESTQLAVDAFVDSTKLIAWATTLKDGKPAGGAELTIAPWGITGNAAADGTATFDLPGDMRPNASLIVRRGKDSAVLPEQLSWWSSGSWWYKRPPSESLRWWTADDRHLYRPGEEVHLKGWLRRFGAGPMGDLMPLAGAAKTVAFSLHDSRGNEVLKGEEPVDALGGFEAKLTLPGTMNLGSAWMQLEAKGGTLGGTSNHVIEVQEFRRPEFEVSASQSPGPYLVGDHATVTVAASYYAGGGLPNAEVYWNVSAQQGWFTPPNREGWSFGTWVPWWEQWNPWSGGSASYAHQAKTDASGKHTLAIDLKGLRNPRPVVLTAQASVMDVNRQAWAASASLLVHPASEYVGLKTPRTFVQKGEKLDIDAIVADLDGNLVVGRKIVLRIARQEWKWENGSYRTDEVEPFENTVVSAKEPARVSFTATEGGTYRVLARIEDPKGRANESELTLWVAGGKTVPSRTIQQERVTLVPDKKDYKPGDTAEVLVVAPFEPSEALIAIEREGFIRTERVTLEGSSYTIKVPIEDAHTPNLHVRVDLVGQAARLTDAGEPDPKLPPRPAFAAGELDLKVPPVQRTLKVEAKPRDAAIAPGGETVVDVSVQDAQGKPVANGQVAVVVVDEAVLALSGYRLPDVLAAFYPELPSGVTSYYLRPHVQLANPEDAMKSAQEHASAEPSMKNEAVGGAAPGAPPAPAPAMRAHMAQAADEADGLFAMGGGGAPKPIAVRSDFNALALFAPAVGTDANGKAEVKLKLPGSLTRYRIMAVGVAGDREFGQSDSQIVARLPLMVRPSAPRFLNFGDRFELPVVLQNQTDAALEVEVAARGANLAFGENPGLKVKVPANDRVEVRFPAATVRAGKARIQVGAVSGEKADAAQLELPVWTPATTEAFATYGEIDEGAVVQPVTMPGAVVKEFGGLEVETSSTALQALTDAVLYLERYPFECSEQLSSRVLAVASLKDVLGAFHAEGLPSPDEMKASVDADMKRLSQIQNWDGGFGFWRQGEESWPYVSIHVANAFARAKAKGFAVPEQTLERSLQYLKTIESHIPPYYGKELKRTLVAYALSVRKRLGDLDTKKAREVLADGGLESLPLEGAGWLLSVFAGDAGSSDDVAAIVKHLENRVAEEAGTAHWTTSYGDGAYLLLHSDRRTDGVVLEAMIEANPKDDVIPKVVRGLLAHRKAGHWTNTQENAFVLIALDKYFGTYEKATPDFVARAWLGDRFAGEHAFKGRTTERDEVKVPMSFLAEGDATKTLTLAKEGPGRLYYRIGMRYAPASLRLEPSDHGFTVTRSYEAVEREDDVKRDEEGSWHVRAGAQIRVRVTMVAPTRRYHVALVDPIPAGLETMNPSLAVTGAIPRDMKAKTNPWWWWSSTWFEHQNLRDERAEAFASLLWEGVHEYTYVCRATTPGNFVVPPAKAEEMYEPETFGRSATDRVIVEAK